MATKANPEKVSDKEMERLVNRFITTAYNIWRNKQMIECSKMWHKCKHPGDTISSKYTFHCGWRAALEWIKNEITQDDINGLDGGCYCFTIIEDIINKELGNE